MYRLICSKIGNSKVESEESEIGLKYLLKARELATDKTIILTKRFRLGIRPYKRI